MRSALLDEEAVEAADDGAPVAVDFLLFDGASDLRSALEELPELAPAAAFCFLERAVVSPEEEVELLLLLLMLLLCCC